MDNPTHGVERRTSLFSNGGMPPGIGRILRNGTRITFCLIFPWLARAAGPPASLEGGYRLMYNLRFESAHTEFLRWQSEHPGDPLGPVSEAANYLFSEFARLGVLEAQLFANDASFRARRKLRPDPAVRARFNAALNRAEVEARQRLAEDVQNFNSLFALTLVYGLKADHAALIEKRNLAALRHTRQASHLAGQLLAVAPDYYDAYLATGIANYIVGSRVAPVRWILRMTGYPGDKQHGMQQLRLAAEKGRFLGPFARILLSLAHLRENEPQQARRLLAGLREEFPSNPLFAREIARIDSRAK